MEPLHAHEAHYKISKSILDLWTLPVTGRPSKEYLKSKPGEFTPDQIVTEITQNRVKIDRTMARILETFDWYFTSRLSVISHFKK